MHTTIRVSILVTASILLPAVADADMGVPAVRAVSSAYQGGEVSLLILPDGSGPPLTQAMTFQGMTVDATVTAVIVAFDRCQDTVANHPSVDMWLDAPGADWRACFGSVCAPFFPADYNTNAVGETVFQRGLIGGGWSLGPLTMYLRGEVATDHCGNGEPFPPIAMRFNSPDINADLRVDLVDVVQFTEDFFGEYAYRSDFIWDGVIDLYDITALAESYGVVNPYLD